MVASSMLEGGGELSSLSSSIDSGGHMVVVVVKDGQSEGLREIS